ncbi:phosphoribosyltransferase family protein [Streptomyces sp. MUM 178J]|uniref:phosphoribosyltransferase family protein n=1 Tax=Streptomyces sp. MUM 178J TaxID=2791991 RepID=UPI001F038652|nr:phosphoribosyltransferase family protein [Streptomyces sp. MUM 178J]WRQ78148.1 phosphoribosyltransferase family protein [Streptomyces sp. MUM 178J]
MYFEDRVDAGRRLAARLEHLKSQDVIVLGLPRGGVPVAAQVAYALDAPLDICLVRKLGVPYQPELGMGAIGEDGARVINDEVMGRAGVSPADLAKVERHERDVLWERARRYRGDRAPLALDGRTAVVIDDGVATGSTALAACRIVRQRGAARVVLAVPVAPPGWTDRLGAAADELICLDTPPGFYAIGQFYADFDQTSDEEVLSCLAAAERRSRARGDPHGRSAQDTAGAAGPVDRETDVAAGPVRLQGRLTVPEGAVGVVMFAHGSGSSRHSPRNRFVAAGLNEAGLGTLLFDLLTEQEAHDRAKVFDTPLLGRRLADATAWLREQPETERLPVGYFGASTGAAAALWAETETGAPIAAVVSRGGRPDLAGDRLPLVSAPTLLIVGGEDVMVLDLNRQAQARLRCENRLAVVPDATHLFEEPGTLEAVTELARNWFTDHFAALPHTASGR